MTMGKLGMIISTSIWVRVLLLLMGAASLSPGALAGGGHPHGDENGQGEVQGHAAEATLVYTDYTEVTELFVEFPPLVVGRSSTFAAHVTRLADFEPLTSGIMDVSLVRGEKTVARFRVKAPARKGLFTPAVTPQQAGDFQLRVTVRDGELHATHNLGSLSVYPNSDAVDIHQNQPSGDIRYLKEAQWDNPFATQPLAKRALRSSVPGFGTVQAPANGSAQVRAPEDGYYSATEIINAGEEVTAQQTLGYLLPRLGQGADIGNLVVELERARSSLSLARRDLERLEALFNQGAIPERRLIEAREKLAVAQVEMQTAQSRLQQRQGKAGPAGIALRAPITAQVVAVQVQPGAFVQAGDPLFTLAVAERRWLQVQVPEKYAQPLGSATGASLQSEPHSQAVMLDTHNQARLVNYNSVIDPATRTASVTFEYPLEASSSTPQPSTIGARFPARVFYGEAQPRLAVAHTAVIDDGGQPVVYVQTAGETFERRPVQLGIQDGSWVEVLRGVTGGERVVSQGAYYVKLAAAGGEQIGHGHAH